MQREILKSRTVTLFFLLLFLFTWTRETLALEPAKLISEETITRGALSQQYRVKTGTGTATAYVTKINLADPYIKIDVLYGMDGKLGKNQTVDKMAEESGAIAAINGDFFDMTSGSLFGPIMQDEKWVTTPSAIDGLSGFALTKSGIPEILSFTFQGLIKTENGQEFPVASINKTFSLANKINVYNSNWNIDALPADNLGSYTYVVVEDDEVQEILYGEKPNEIPDDGYIILGQGLGAQFLQANVQLEEEITFDFQMDQGDDWQFVIGAHTPLIENSTRVQFTRNIAGYHARTAVGYSKNKVYVYWVVIENSKNSTGMTLEELADFMIQLGIDYGVNLDGGGSTTIVSRHPGDTSPSLINIPEKTNLRAVPDGLGLYSTAPEGKLKDFIIGAPSFLLVNESTFLNLKAIDEYDNPLDIENQDVNWKTNNDAALVDKNQLTGIKPGSASIEIKSDQIERQFNIEIVGREQISSLNLGVKSLLLNPEDQFTLKPVIGIKNGLNREVSPTLLHWEWVGVQGSIKKDGEMQAGTVPGTGWLIGTYDRFSTMVPVQIGTTNQVIVDFENNPDISFLGSPQEVSGDFTLTKSDKKDGNYSGELSYDFSQATGDVQAAYGQFDPDEVCFSAISTGISLLVRGDESNYWLRAEILDQNGQIQYITLADKLNWSGWKELSVDFPLAIEKPILKRIYLVNLNNASGDRPAQGSILLDKISFKAAVPVTPESRVLLKLYANKKLMTVNGAEQIIDQGPIVEQGRSYIPARYMIEALGGKVFWNAQDKQVRILLGEDMIDLWVNDKDHTIVNGENKASDTAPIIRNNRTLIPVRMVTENLGYKVDWSKGEITIKN